MKEFENKITLIEEEKKWLEIEYNTTKVNTEERNGNYETIEKTLIEIEEIYKKGKKRDLEKQKTAFENLFVSLEKFFLPVFYFDSFHFNKYLIFLSKSFEKFCVFNNKKFLDPQFFETHFESKFFFYFFFIYLFIFFFFFFLIFFY